MASIRPAAVAGSFYPANAGELSATVRAYLSAAKVPEGAAVPKAIIAPHAGHVYSGPVAASVYARLAPARGRITRVVLIGPSHRAAFQGMALTTAAAYETPLGMIPIDTQAVRALWGIPGVRMLDAVHGPEHSLEVHLPFLQEVLGSFDLVPIVAGDAGPETVSEVLDAAWGGPETLIVVSTDLSHYLPYEACCATDARTVKAIETLDTDAIGFDQACGRVPVRGLLASLRKRGLKMTTVDVRNSGDTSGKRDKVVGYGAWVCVDPSACLPPSATESRPASGKTAAASAPNPLLRHGETLLRLAAASIRHGLNTGRPFPVDVEKFDPELRAPGAAFVTLYREKMLRGCIGSIQAHRPLVTDVAVNAQGAAFADSRFRPLGQAELNGLELSISVLTPPTPMSFRDEADLLAQMRPGVDGLILEDKGHRGLFLPMVWESLPSPVEFLNNLKLKAHLPESHWSPTVAVSRFETHSISSRSLYRPAELWLDGKTTG